MGHTRGASRRLVGPLVVVANILKEGSLDFTLNSVIMTRRSSNVRYVSVGRIEVVGSLGNFMLPGIALRAGSAAYNLRSIASSSTLTSTLGNSTVVVDGSRSSVVVFLNALNEVELLEFIGNNVESACLDLVPVAFSGAVLAAECVLASIPRLMGISIGIEGNVRHV